MTEEAVQRPPRRYDTSAIRDLIADARDGSPDVAYLADALGHYLHAYGDLRRKYEELYESARMLALHYRGGSLHADELWRLLHA